MSADRNLLFAVLALQADCVTREQFIDACTAWAANKTTPIDTLMVQRGWLAPEDRADVQRLVERKLKKYSGEIRSRVKSAEVDGDASMLSIAARKPPMPDAITATAIAPNIRNRID